MAFLPVCSIFVMILTNSYFSVVLGAQPGSLVDTLCEKTPHYEFCINYLETNFNAKALSDPKELTWISVISQLKAVQETKDNITQLLNKRFTDDPQRACLLYCDYEYNNAFTTAQKALSLVNSGSYQDLSGLAALVHSNADLCERNFDAGQSLLTSRNLVVMEISDIAIIAPSFIV